MGLRALAARLMAGLYAMGLRAPTPHTIVGSRALTSTGEVVVGLVRAPELGGKGAVGAYGVAGGFVTRLDRCLVLSGVSQGGVVVPVELEAQSAPMSRALLSGRSAGWTFGGVFSSPEEEEASMHRSFQWMAGVRQMHHRSCYNTSR
ncbi:hypothetical protein PF005_g4380 [Phytophthora fragariae]|uniref:Uncharacterized protein n=2 Tax=Phytophthora fragariae TaxID=53985 RepID=A0A6A3Z4H4_9STRA|nr:hypothetical protein PF011_g6494 [Phytophthora fragariae]KAE9228302.1 hypothetical protein PF005_g4380 [Phytophthora fragariae]KAE9242232.1 hypothetical protein PF002_g8859 [Phytophthora fragariae]KAE9323594.1 hypothetical protein PF001_g3846 [Phytophthora fragariae]